MHSVNSNAVRAVVPKSARSVREDKRKREVEWEWEWESDSRQTVNLSDLLIYLWQFAVAVDIYDPHALRPKAFFANNSKMSEMSRKMWDNKVR